VIDHDDTTQLQSLIERQLRRLVVPAPAAYDLSMSIDQADLPVSCNRRMETASMGTMSGSLRMPNAVGRRRSKLRRVTTEIGRRRAGTPRSRSALARRTRA